MGGWGGGRISLGRDGFYFGGCESVVEVHEAYQHWGWGGVGFG